MVWAKIEYLTGVSSVLEFKAIRRAYISSKSVWNQYSAFAMSLFGFYLHQSYDFCMDFFCFLHHNF